MSRIPRGFSSFALWIFIGLAMAAVPLACSSSSTPPPSDGAPNDMTKSG